MPPRNRYFPARARNVKGIPSVPHLMRIHFKIKHCGIYSLTPRIEFFSRAERVSGIIFKTHK